MCECMGSEKVQQLIQKYNGSKEKIIQILLELQEASGQNYLPEKWIHHTAKGLDIPVSKVYDVVTFYSMFSLEPRGKNVVEICKSGPCHVNQPKGIVAMFESELGIKMGDTTEDKLFTLQYSSCFGACDIAPAVKIGNKVYGNLDEDKIKNIIDSYREV